jgi:hypothetical protein
MRFSLQKTFANKKKNLNNLFLETYTGKYSSASD